ncbi:MAG: ATP-binding protein [Niastella sp.]|nr:ATP-binding protein [Niastella sp.]
MKPVKKIVIIGPESTGKSTLSAQLAAHYNTLWAKEYAREYLETHGTRYHFEDLFTIAQGQLQNEETALASLTKNQHLLFIDTDMYVIKVWSEYVFNRCDNRILNEIAKRKYDLYLLCATDLPWVADALREYPDLATRDKLFHYYKDLLVHQQVPWQIIDGGYDERLQKAIKAVDGIL